VIPSQMYPESDDAGKNMKTKYRPWHPVFSGATPLHTLLMQDVAEWSKQNDEQNKDVSFQVQARRIFHTCLLRAALPFIVLARAVAVMRVSVRWIAIVHPE